MKQINIENLKQDLKDLDKVYDSLPHCWEIKSQLINKELSKFKRLLEIYGEELENEIDKLKVTK